MTNYHLKPPQPPPVPLPRQRWEEKRDKRRKQLAEVRNRRLLIYQRFLQKMRLQPSGQ